MNITQIQDTINTIFTEKKKRVVFWYDGAKEFEEVLPSIHLENVKIVRLDQVSSLALKIEIEGEAPTRRYLLYAPYHEPAPAEDWLLDIRLYSYTFQADKASVILKELNLDSQSMRPYLKKRSAFFNSKERFKRLRKWVQPDDREDDLDLKMLCVLTRADQPDLFAVLLKLFASFGDADRFDASLPAPYWTAIEKLGLAAPFWKFTAQTFGYIQKEPKLHDFLLRIFVTDFANQMGNDPPPSLEHFLIPSPSHAMNATVFLSQWRSHMIHFKTYNRIAGHIARKLKIADLLIPFPVDSLIEVMTFEAVERRIISLLRDALIADSGYDDASMRALIKKRLDGYWATITWDESTPVNLYKTVYKALETAMAWFNLRRQYDTGFSYPDAEAMFKAYAQEVFRFDQLYRVFNELADKAEMAGWDVLKTLRRSVEAGYSGWFMDQLALKWGEFLEGGQGLLAQWKLPYIANQYDFFSRNIAPTLTGSSRNRLFVVISDALRYEAAQELEQIINGQYRMKAELAPMLGVLPSDTALGMASLLPHRKLAFKESSGQVLVDLKPSNSLAYRQKILAQHNGIALKADDLTAMRKDQGREFVKPYRLIYIYHDRIDAMGDKKVSENQTFGAVRQAIEDLTGLINYIINNLNGTRVLVSADHGFVYHDQPPAPIDKSALDIGAKTVIKKHKRFVLGHDLDHADNALWGSTRNTAHTDTDTRFLIPKGTNRFNFVGGAKFYHGGALLQEIVIPVLSVTQMKGKHLEASEINQVGVALISAPKKIVTNITRFEFIQTDAVSPRFKPRVLKISIRDGNQLISDEKMLTFDSESASIDERKKTANLTLKTGRTFDNQKAYDLVLRNADDDTEYDRVTLMIDIAFAADF